MSSRTTTTRAINGTQKALATLLDVPFERVIAGVVHENSALLQFKADKRTYVIATSRDASALSVRNALQILREHEQQPKRGSSPTRVIVVPYMGDTGRVVCRAAQMNWFDLSGNAHIVNHDLRIIVEGKPNLFRAAGRPSNIFAPMSARVTRWLLLNQNTPQTQSEIASAVGMDEGFVSRLVARLEREGLVERIRGKGRRRVVKVPSPSLLFDAWREKYAFAKHIIIQGHITARTGDSLAQFIAERLEAANLRYAATGLAAAWQYSHYAAFRLATIYLESDPSQDLLSTIGFREESRGANTWLVVPNDEGVFQNAIAVDGIVCVHPLQAYLDLKFQPERASDAMRELQQSHLNWTLDVQV